jgi:putative phosphoesterase
VKIGVISDTHLQGCHERLERIAATIFRDVDLILHAGDLVDIAVLDAFAPKEVMAVFGNMDPQGVRDVLPEKRVWDIEGRRFALVHGWGDPAGIEERLIDYVGPVDCLVYGHTHNPVNERWNGTLFFNPGSAFDRRFAAHNTVGLLDVGEEMTGSIVVLDEFFEEKVT